MLIWNESVSKTFKICRRHLRTPSFIRHNIFIIVGEVFMVGEIYSIVGEVILVVGEVFIVGEIFIVVGKVVFVGEAFIAICKLFIESLCPISGL